MKKIFKILFIIKISMFLGSMSLNGQSFTATGFQYHYQVGADNTFDKPIIILEGFDIKNDKSAFDHYNDWNDFLYDLKDNGYDIITLSYDDPYKSMHDNTQHLKNFIKEVKNKKEDDFEITIIGQSMGGVISRMALAELENESYDHQTGLYVSFDAPHKGANIPLGIQTFTQDLLEVDIVEFFDACYDLYTSLTNTDSEKPWDVYWNALNSLAARQMVIHHFKQGNHNYFGELQQYLTQLGYPDKSKNVALINGNNRGERYNYSPGDNYFYYEWGGNCDFLAMTYTIDIDISKVNATHDRVSLIRMRSPPGCIKLTNRRGHGDFGPYCYDNAPGSSTGPLSSYELEFCFMPTVSSIDLDQSIIDDHGLDYFDVSQNRNAQFLIENGHVPFDNIYSNFSNTNHVDEDEYYTSINITNIIEQQIMWDRKYLQYRTITGDRDFEATTSITAGENVRSFADQYNGETGKFVIESGKTTLSAPQVLLESGFEVKKGAEFEIK